HPTHPLSPYTTLFRSPAPAPTPGAPKLDGLSAGSSVAGQVSLSASVPAGTRKVDFQVDGATVATVAAPPFTTIWDSFSVANGPQDRKSTRLNSSHRTI